MVFACLGLNAQTVADGAAEAENVKIGVDAKQMQVSFDLKANKIKYNRYVVITPEIRNGNQSVALTPVTVYGHKAYNYALRNDELKENALRSWRKNKYNTISYKESVPFQPWMNGSKLYINGEEFGCCGQGLIGSGSTPTDASYKKPAPAPVQYTPEYAYVEPKSEEAVKTRCDVKTARISFTTGNSTLSTNLNGNAAELKNLIDLYESVNNDPDCVVKGVSVTGYASPDGPESLNNSISKMRSQSIQKYLTKNGVPANLVTAKTGGEDWAGVIAWLETSDLANKNALLDIAKSNASVDAKESEIKTNYPEDWKTLIADCFPSLRNTTYGVDYDVRSFVSAEEIVKKIEESPKKVSLNEFAIAEKSLAQGSEKYNEIVKIAAETYPEDEVSNINAANVALAEGDLKAAENYLKNAGNSDEAVYTMGVLAAQKGDYAKAVECFTKAQATVSAAKAQLENVKKVQDYLKAVAE